MIDAVTKSSVSKRIIAYETGAFAFLFVLVWLDEIIDIPYLFLGAEKTPINWRESLFESAVILMVGVIIISCTDRLLRRMKYLEGILPICASCKRIRKKDDSWHPIESYLREQSDAEFTHGICPECAKKLYPEYYKEISRADEYRPAGLNVDK